MSLVSPIPQQTLIKIYKGVDWDKSNENIRWFTSETERQAYFSSRAIGVWENCSVVSPGKSIRIQTSGTFNDLMVGNYLSFQNTGFGTSNITWYAFIDEINYINAQTTEIVYSIDWIQTYRFSYGFESCFVEREHVNDDTFGKHTVDERIDTGEYCIHNVHDHTYEKAIRMLYLSQVDTDVELKKLSGVACGVNYIADTYDNPWGTVTQMLQELNSNGEANEVVDLCMCVAPMVTSLTGMHETFNVQNDGKLFAFGTEQYTAVNNKMQCYPYKFMTIDNYEGSVEQFRYENFTGSTYTFAIEGTAMPKPCMECFPVNYQGWQGSSDSPNTVQQMAVMFTNFPEIPWTSDTFRAWVSQNSATLIGSGISKFVTSATGFGMMSTGNFGGIVPLVSGATGLAELSQDIQKHKIHSEELQGSIPSAGMSYFRDTIGFRATQYCIRPEMARKIDKYFTRYGYRVNETKIPNILGRQYVNYVKCHDAQVKGDVPVDAKIALENAMNRGCSFWHTDNIGADLSSNPIL